MKTIETQEQYDKAIHRIEELYRQTDEDTSSLKTARRISQSLNIDADIVLGVQSNHYEENTIIIRYFPILCGSHDGRACTSGSCKATTA